ncbi:hypothetical protein Hanom_Chr02g00110041 [Helianthus anomalus]
MFSNLSRSCVRGRTSEHGMSWRIMLKSPCITLLRKSPPTLRKSPLTLRMDIDSST